MKSAVEHRGASTLDRAERREGTFRAEPIRACKPVLPKAVCRSHDLDARNDRAHSFAAATSFKRSEILQTLIDVAAVLALFLLICATAISIAAAAFICFFVAL